MKHAFVFEANITLQSLNELSERHVILFWTSIISHTT